MRVEVCAALAAADRKAGQGVLQSLLHTEELKNRLVYRRMETETALVRSDGRIELYSVSEIYVVYTLIIGPWYSERNDSLRLDKSLQKSILTIYILVLRNDRVQRLENSLCSLEKLRLVRMLRL